MTAHAIDFAGSAPPLWASDTDSRLRCVQVRAETHDIKTFVLAAPAGRHFRYLPGQFITLELNIGGQPVNRCYTLSSTPTRPDRVSITVKRVPGGPVSNWLHDHLHEGDELSVMGPSGAFSCFEKTTDARYLFISGGSGVTPLMSMARALHDIAPGSNVVFVHCARTPADVPFAEELALMAKNMPHFRLRIVCEHAGDQPAYAGYHGRINEALLANMAPDYMAREVYTCGPAPFMNAVRGMLAGAGFDMTRYSEESFCFDDPAPAATAPVPADAAAPVAAGFKIHLHKVNSDFTCPADQPLLQAATAAGVRIPFSCSNGVCGTCKTLKLSGEVAMTHGGGIRKREIEQGWILPCCSRPLSDVVLDR